MKHKRTMLLVVCLSLVMTFAFAGVASADSHGSGSITGKGYTWSGGSLLQTCTNMTTGQVTTQMSSGGHLYNSGKAIALISASLYSTVDRVRVLPSGNGQADLRIDPNLQSNWVGPGQSNLTKQVRGVQTLLQYSVSPDTSCSIDGSYGTQTLRAIQNFQSDRGLSRDGIAGAKTWRALCSSSTYVYGSSIW